MGDQGVEDWHGLQRSAGEDHILAILLHHMIIRETIPLSQYSGSEIPIYQVSVFAS